MHSAFVSDSGTSTLPPPDVADDLVPPETQYEAPAATANALLALQRPTPGNKLSYQNARESESSEACVEIKSGFTAFSSC